MLYVLKLADVTSSAHHLKSCLFRNVLLLFLIKDRQKCWLIWERKWGLFLYSGMRLCNQRLLYSDSTRLDWSTPLCIKHSFNPRVNIKAGRMFSDCKFKGIIRNVAVFLTVFYCISCFICCVFFLYDCSNFL